MSKKAKPDFWDAFAELPENHKATISVAMQMYAQVMRTGFGSVTFSRKEIELLPIFDGEARPLDWGKASDFASAVRS